MIATVLVLRRLFSGHPRLATLGGTAIVFIVGFAHFQSLRETAELAQQRNGFLRNEPTAGAIASQKAPPEKSSGLIHARLARAMAYENSGAWGHAISDYENILRVSPGDPTSLKRCGWLHLTRADYPSAIRCYQALVSENAADSLDLLNLANALAANKEHAQALILFDRYLKAHPDNTQVVAKRERALLHLNGSNPC
jgi:tetratricopeptide (TPR) repeat protein